MPCGGPSIEHAHKHAHKLGDEIFASLEKELSEKHHIRRNTTGRLIPKDDEEQNKNFDKLHELIKTIVWKDHCFW